MTQTNDDTSKQKEAWLDNFVEKMSNPGPNEEARFKERQRRGLGIGLDSEGNLVHASEKLSKS